MAAFNHFYEEELTAQSDGTGGFVTLKTIAASGQLVANTKYVIVARGLWNGTDSAQVYHMRVRTADDSGIEAKSESIIEPNSSASDDGQPYFFVHPFITAPTATDIILEFKTDNAADTVQADQLSFAVLDLDDISAPNLLGTFHFDASDAGPTDASADWTNDANAFDGSISTSATSDGGTGALTGEGTTAPTTGATIGLVTTRFTVKVPGSAVQPLTLDIDEDSVGGTNLLSVTVFSTTKTTREFTITAPAGGWTFQKVNDLACSFTPGASGVGDDVFQLEVKVYDSNGRGYFETVHDDPGDAAADEYPTTQADEYTIPGADLGTDEFVVWAYQRTGIGSAGRNYRLEILTALDASSNAVVGTDEDEGEDTKELRMSGFTVRHKASSGTPDIAIQSWESGGNGNMFNRGGYAIALPTSLFADVKMEYTAGSQIIDTSEDTFETIISYKPSVTADHWLFSMWNQTSTTFTRRVRMHIEDDGVEMRVGDADIESVMGYDVTATPGLMLFHQDNILSSDTSTYTLRGISNQTDETVEHRWLIILSLEKAAVAAGAFPPFHRRQLTTVRM